MNRKKSHKAKIERKVERVEERDKMEKKILK